MDMAMQDIRNSNPLPQVSLFISFSVVIYENLKKGDLKKKEEKRLGICKTF